MTQNKTVKQNETGRTLMEAVATLAIMGVLSISGIAGYRYAVDRNVASNITEEVRKRAVVVSQQIFLGKREHFNLSEFPAKINNAYSVSISTNNETETFDIRVEGIDKSVCTKVRHRKIALGQMQDGECSSEDDNSITYRFTFLLNSGDPVLGNNQNEINPGN